VKRHKVLNNDYARPSILFKPMDDIVTYFPIRTDSIIAVHTGAKYR